MADTAKERGEQTQATETTATNISVPDLKSDRDELMVASQQLLRTLVRTGVHLATKPVYMLPQEPREHFVNAGREFSRGLTLLAQELTETLDKTTHERKENGEKASECPDSLEYPSSDLIE